MPAPGPAAGLADGSGLTPEEFSARFLDPHEPCALPQCAREWPALRKWSYDFLRDAVPADTHVDVACSAGAPSSAGGGGDGDGGGEDEDDGGDAASVRARRGGGGGGGGDSGDSGGDSGGGGCS